MRLIPLRMGRRRSREVLLFEQIGLLPDIRRQGGPGQRRQKQRGQPGLCSSGCDINSFIYMNLSVAWHVSTIAMTIAPAPSIMSGRSIKGAVSDSTAIHVLLIFALVDVTRRHPTRCASDRRGDSGVLASWLAPQSAVVLSLFVNHGWDYCWS